MCVVEDPSCSVDIKVGWGAVFISAGSRVSACLVLFMCLLGAVGWSRHVPCILLTIPTSVRHPFKKVLCLGIRASQLFTLLYRVAVLWSLLLIIPHKAQFLNQGARKSLSYLCLCSCF